MNKTELQNEREDLFDESFDFQSEDVDRIKKFCRELCDETGVQVCNNNGMTYEYLPQVYRSVLSKI